jgi:hypothetical protein
VTLNRSEPSAAGGGRTDHDQALGFFRETGQGTKAAVGSVLGVGGAIVLLTAARGAFGEGDRGMWIVLGSMATSAAGFIYLCTAIRCPKCSTRVVWHHMQHGSAADWMGGSVDWTACPVCASRESAVLPKQGDA